MLLLCLAAGALHPSLEAGVRRLGYSDAAVRRLEEPVLASHSAEAFSIPWWRGAPRQRSGNVTWSSKDGACGRATMDAATVATLQAHVCGTKCKSSADPGCQGFLQEFAHDTTALCATLGECKALCFELGTCYGFDISVRADGSYNDRCYLHTDRCKVDVAQNRLGDGAQHGLVDDPHYEFHFLEEEPRSGQCNLGKGVSVNVVGDHHDHHAVGGLYVAVVGEDESGHVSYYKSIGYQTETAARDRPARIIWHHSGCGWVVEAGLPQEIDHRRLEAKDDADAANALFGLTGAAADPDLCAKADFADYCTHPLFAAACQKTCKHSGKDDIRKSVQYARENGREPEAFACDCTKPEKLLCPQTCAGPHAFSAADVFEFRASMRRALEARGGRRTSALRRLAEVEYLEVYTAFHPPTYPDVPSCIDFSARTERPLLAVLLDRSESMYPAKWFDTQLALKEISGHFMELDYALASFPEDDESCSAHHTDPVIGDLGAMLGGLSPTGQKRPLYRSFNHVGHFLENRTGCANTDNGAVDQTGDGCAVYFESWCGQYDDDDFKSSEMCCICKGGASSGGAGGLLLITDGKDSCDDDLDMALHEADRLKNQGISTYVVGVGNDIDLDALDRIALQGGSGQAFHAKTLDDMVHALAFVVERVQGVPQEPEVDHMYDTYEFRQPVFEMSATYHCTKGYTWNPEWNHYCPHNNLAVADMPTHARIESCAAKCNGRVSKKDAPGQPGFCGGNAGLVDTSNAICAPLSKCQELCELLDDCSSVDWDHTNGKRCWLNGPHCPALRAEHGLEQDGDLSYYEKEATGLQSSSGLGEESCFVELTGSEFAGTYESFPGYAGWLLKKDASAALWFSSVIDEDDYHCDGWSLSANDKNDAYHVVRANCSDMDYGEHIGIIDLDPLYRTTGLNKTGQPITCAPLKDGGSFVGPDGDEMSCDNSPILRAVCRASCNDARWFQTVYNIETGRHQLFQVEPDYAGRLACPNMDDAAELVSFNATLGAGYACDQVASVSDACNDIEGFKNACPATCYDYIPLADQDALHTAPVEILTKDWMHMEYTAAFRTWVNGSEHGFSAWETHHLYSEDDRLNWLDGIALPACAKERNESAAAMLSFFDKEHPNFNRGYWFAVDSHAVDVGMSPVCESTPICRFGTFCVMTTLEHQAEIARFRKHTTECQHNGAPCRLAHLDWHEMQLLFDSPDTWDDKKEPLDDDKGFGFGKILATEARADAVMRVKEYMYGKEVFRASPLHTRVRVAEFPPEAVSFVLSVSSPDPDDLTVNFGYGTPAAAPGYTAWMGDVIRLDLVGTNEYGTPQLLDAGKVVLEVFAPGVTDAFGLKVFGFGRTGRTTWAASPVAAAVEPLEDGWQRLTLDAKDLGRDIALAQNVDECAGALPEGCESHEDGGSCVDEDGSYSCGCRDGFKPVHQATNAPAALAKGRKQCILASWTPTSQSVLIYPQTALKHSWRVNEVSIYTGVKDGKCSGSKIAKSGIENVRASKHFPDHPAARLTDGKDDTYWQSYDLIVNRSQGTGAWIAFEVAQDYRVSCVRIKMSACEGLPGTLAVHKQAGGAAPEVSEAWTTVGHAFRAPGRPGWTLTKVYDVNGEGELDMPVTCGIVGAQYFGELLLEYPGVPSACECAQLCLDHVDEGCVTWKWFDDGERYTCYLQTDTFIGDDATGDSLGGTRASHRGASVYKTEQGWWRRGFSENWPGWVTGGTGPLPTSVSVDGEAPPAAMTPRKEFELTLHGIGFPDDREALERQRIKIVRDEDNCVTGMPPEEVEGVKCTNWFTCAPRPVKADRYSATWDGLSLAPSKGVAKYKVCWCDGKCWEPQNWIVVPTSPPLVTHPSVYVWSLLVNGKPSKDLDVTRKDSPVTIAVTRRPFATKTAVADWRLKLVRDVHDCDLLGSGKLCGGADDCGAPTYLSPDDGSWQVEIAQDADVGEYKVCLSDEPLEPAAANGTAPRKWRQLAASDQLFLRVKGLPEDSAHPRGLFAGQVVSARQRDHASVEVSGYRLAEPFSGRLAVTAGGCEHGANILRKLDADPQKSSQDKVVFTGDLSGVGPGGYDLCYCDEQKDNTLTATGTTYRLTEFFRNGNTLTAAQLMGQPDFVADNLCKTKCERGCVTPECFCDGFAADEPDALCLDAAGCRQACDAAGDDCDGYTMHRLLNRCLLFDGGAFPPGSTPAGDVRDDNFHTWSKLQGTACAEDDDFTAVEQEDLFAKAVGQIHITSRFDLDAEFVVTPGEKTSLEIVGPQSDLDPLKDRIMVIECNEQCGLASQSSAVKFARSYPVNSFVDLPALQERPRVAASVPAAQDARQWSFKEINNTYCPGNNVAAKVNTYTEQHQCSKKCGQGDCVGDDCFCDGFLDGHDDEDSTALCLDQDSCEQLCKLMDCHSIDMHRELPRCFINQGRKGVHPCDPVFRRDSLTPSLDYDLLVKTLDENSQRKLQALGRSLTAGHVRELLQAPDRGLSWNQVLRFADVEFAQAGTYRVCACDSSQRDCTRPSDYLVEIGKVHASGLQCLLGQEHFVRGECVAQFHGGLRCYQGDAPEVDLGELGLPMGLDVEPYHTMEQVPPIAAEPEVVTALTAFCLYGPPERKDFGFCDSLA